MSATKHAVDQTFCLSAIKKNDSRKISQIHLTFIWSDINYKKKWYPKCYANQSYVCLHFQNKCSPENNFLISLQHVEAVFDRSTCLFLLLIHLLFNMSIYIIIHVCYFSTYFFILFFPDKENMSVKLFTLRVLCNNYYHYTSSDDWCELLTVHHQSRILMAFRECHVNYYNS